MNTNRSAVWALVGVAVGFGLPVVALIGLILAVGFGAAQLTGAAAPSMSARYTQVSGPERRAGGGRARRGRAHRQRQRVGV